MIYEEFLSYLIHGLHLSLGPETKVQFHKFPKNNGTWLDALCILEPQERSSPAIYLKDYWKRYENGVSEGQILKEILDFYQEGKNKFQHDISLFEDFESVKPFLSFKLINAKDNEQLLLDVPHKIFLDLAIVYYIYFQSPSVSSASAIIHHEHLDLWDISPETLHQATLESTKLILPPSLLPIDELIRQIVREEMTSLELGDPSESDELFRDLYGDLSRLPMYVLTNTQKYLGASCLLHKELLKDFSAEHQCDFYILPSSIHEVILVPEVPNLSLLSLQEMVKEINSTAVDSTEKLSDQVYYYCAESDSITLTAE